MMYQDHQPLGSSLEPWSKTKSTLSQSGSQGLERVFGINE